MVHIFSLYPVSNRERPGMPPGAQPKQKNRRSQSAAVHRSNRRLNIVISLLLHGQRQVLLREVEHVEDDGFGAAVLAMVNVAYHLDNGSALMHHLLQTVLADDGQISLHQDTEVHHGMIMHP